MTLYLVCATYYREDDDGKRIRMVGAPLGVYTDASEAARHKSKGDDLEITCLVANVKVST